MDNDRTRVYMDLVNGRKRNLVSSSPLLQNYLQDRMRFVAPI
jgi:hypothetical protein